MATRPDVPCLALVSLLLAAPATSAAPPPVDSDDWQIMHPFAEWVTSQHGRDGAWCCDIGDGRPVEAIVGAYEINPHVTGLTAHDLMATYDPTRDSHWFAHITPQHFPSESDHWIVVPDSKIVSGGNPTGEPILWLLHGSVQCFAPPYQS